MTDEMDVVGLAKLARLELTDAELEKLKKELPAILTFVETIQQANTGKVVGAPMLHNVMRTDENPHESGKYTKRLLEAAPARTGDRFAVKQVISRKKK
jgi:aspartyl-tRNA(Asn)/glutamyl-tRNA(Gln) amidotransferase subunit C